MKPISPNFSPTPREEVEIPAAAMIFAAGLGARMRPLTERIPKPLVRVGGKALIDYALDDFAAVGVKKAIVNVHHLAGQIEAHLALRAAPKIVISNERAKLLDQGGGIKKVLTEFEGSPFFVCNTDAFWKDAGAANFRALARAFDPNRMDAALLLADTQESVGVDWEGDFELDDDGRISRPSGPRRYVYSGVGILKPELFADVAEDVFRLAPLLFAAAERERLFGVPARSLWLHVGTVAAIAEAEAAIAA